MLLSPFMFNKSLISSLTQEKLFLCFAVSFGLMFLLITPPFQAPDEGNHYFRAFQVSEGRLKAEKQDDGVGGTLPASLLYTFQHVSRDIPFHPENKQKIGDILSLIDLPLQKKEREFIHFPNTALYSPVPYLPQASGIFVGKLFGLSPILLMYMGRVSNLLVWLILIYLAIKITPVYKWVFLLLSLTPMSLFQAASLSADVFTNGISFLFISLILQIAYGEKKTPSSHIIYLLILLTVLLSLSKQVYFILPLLFLIIPRNKIGSLKKYYALFLLLFFLSLASMMFWYFSVSDISREVFRIYLPNTKPAVHPGKQVSFILSYPVKFLEIMVNTFMREGRGYLEQFIGILGWLDTKLPGFIINSYLAVLCVIALIENRKNIRISIKDKLILFCTSVICIVLVFLAMYIGWSRVGYNFIEGVQGRYFIPISPVIFLLLYNKKITVGTERVRWKIFISSFVLLVLSWTVYVLIKRYY